MSVSTIINIVIVLLILVMVLIPGIKIIKSILIEKKCRSILENPVADYDPGLEPFPGAVYLSALLVFLCGSADFAEAELKAKFNRTSYKSDWGTYCRVAWELKEKLNDVTLVECLGGILKRRGVSGKLLDSVFDVIIRTESLYGDRFVISRPSVYLSTLLSYNIRNDELIDAFRTLNLDFDSSFGEVKAAHRRLAAMYHPDSTHGDKELFMKVQKAYETILKFRENGQLHI